MTSAVSPTTQLNNQVDDKANAMIAKICDATMYLSLYGLQLWLHMDASSSSPALSQSSPSSRWKKLKHGIIIQNNR
eukprot:CAMPEP_0198108572 /NCGR_PEP_ID=MMETSP1442-20131203/633_1 /TAXON_ID= /ORGANISM="Craspedostauros australis, Strain CCMP3328" /LENGTH=75 /DNA_ID=CAMNT_0043763883 /DNA_START=154 /DNA_END=381 /DNA_ORIENTATION=+